MGSIAVDEGIAKLGSPADFYKQLEPDKIAEHIVATSQGDMRVLVERIIKREHPQLWRDLPSGVREAIHSRVQQQLPDIVHSVTDEIGRNVDQLLDVKLMVIRHLQANPKLANRVFEDVGERELKFIINFGFCFGFSLGIPLIFITQALPEWWILPIAGTAIGYVTNLLAIKMIFEPIEQRRIGPLLFQGLFVRRQREVADVYGKIIADDVVTLANIGQELLNGPRSDRTHQLIERALLPAVDRATGPARAAVRVAMGTREYDAIRSSVALEAVEYTMTPLADPQFNHRQGAAVRELIATRMREMPPEDFVELLRTAIEQDEWLLSCTAPCSASARGWSTSRSSNEAARRNQSCAVSSPGRVEDGDLDLPGAIPGLVRLAAGSWLRTARWTAGASARAGGRLARAAVAPQSAGELVQDVRGIARSWLGIDEPAGEQRGEDGAQGPGQTSGSLRERGAELLRRSADVRYQEDVHPAYERILGELAPDEARILRFLAGAGPQPSVDVRASKALNVSSQLVASGLSMIGAGTGARYLERVPAYLNNLHRLGFIWFSREPLGDPLEYQVLEAQPEVMEALKSGPGRGRTAARLPLTPFGVDFCRQCVPVAFGNGEIGHESAGSPTGDPVETTTELENG